MENELKFKIKNKIGDDVFFGIKDIRSGYRELCKADLAPIFCPYCGRLVKGIEEGGSATGCGHTDKDIIKLESKEIAFIPAPPQCLFAFLEYPLLL